MTKTYSPEGLIRAAEKAGHEVSRRQLKRWWNEDLLERPATPGRGRGGGRAVVFKSSVLTQLRALLELRRFTDSPVKLRAQLWLDGYPVPLHRIRADLTAALPLSALDELQLKEQEVPASVVRKWRSRSSGVLNFRELSAPDGTAVIQYLYDSMVTGELPHPMDDAIDEEPTGFPPKGITFGAAIETALGLDEARDGETAWLSGEQGAVAGRAVEHGGLNLRTMIQCIHTITDDELDFAREVLVVAKEASGVRHGAWLARMDTRALVAMIAASVHAGRSPELMEAITQP